MAPALSDTARKHLPDGELHPRRALTSVGNLSPHMEDEMGLQSAANLSKDSQEMEQMLVELGGGDIGQADLLQAIKTLESGGDGLSSSDADAIFPLAGFERDELLETGDSEGDVAEDKIRAMQARLERRASFLLRRMRIHQARAIGKRVSEESAQTVDRCGRAMRREGGAGRPSGLKSVLKRIETTATLQANAAARPQPGPSYYRAGRDESVPAASLGVARGALAGLEETAGALRSHLRIVETQLDSDATASSSGAESNDETVSYTNLYQEPMPLERRALWHWQRRRASLAARWAWLQAQVQELEYKIRQHSDLHRKVRAEKGAVQFAGEPGGYEGRLPGADEAEGAWETCARVRPLRAGSFRKRKLLQMHNLHMAAAKAAKPADIRCGCQWPIWGCGVCTGRAVATQPLPPASTLPPRQRLALLDPGYHPVLSDIHDVSPSIHMAALSSRSWWAGRARAARGSRHAAPAAPAAPAAVPHHHSAAPHHHTAGKKKKHHNSKLRKNRPSISRKSRDLEDNFISSERGRVRGGGGVGGSAGAAAAAGDGGAGRRLNSSSYDIDNIVIPPSVAATTRLEILHYKEIPTPKWRVLDVPAVPPLNNGVVKSERRPSHATHATHATHASAHDSDQEEEDTSEESVAARHRRAEQTEHAKYARKQRTRRSNHQNSTESQPAVEGNGGGSVHLLSCGEESNPSADVASPPATPAATAAETNGPSARRPDPPPHETVRPYSPRAFPLPDAVYRHMLQTMPRGHPLSSPEPAEPPRSPTPPSEPPDVEDYDPPSPMSPLYFEDDPNDPEWDEEKEDKR